MKKLSRIAAFALALVMLLSTTFALAEQDEDNPVLVTIGDNAIAKAEVDETMQILYDNGYISSLTDYDVGLQYIVQNFVIGKKIAELGFDQFTDEEKAAFTASAQAEWDAACNEYVTYFLSEDTEEARAELLAAANEYYKGQGFSVELLADNTAMSQSYERLEKYVLEGKDVSVTDEEVVATFEQFAGMDKETYAGNVAMYEYYTHYYGEESWYVPAGYRGITHILLNVDDALMTAYTDANAAYEEALSAANGATGEDAATDEAATEDKPDLDALKAAADAARQAIFDAAKETIDAINAKLSEGVAFADLIAEYGNDPGMTDAATLATGYAVHPESIVWDAPFTAAAFGEKMKQPGDVSDPILGANGIHILYYLRDIPEGNIELSDDIRAMISEYLVSNKTTTLYTTAIQEWIDAYDIVYNTEVIEALKATDAAVTE